MRTESKQCREGDWLCSLISACPEEREREMHVVAYMRCKDSSKLISEDPVRSVCYSAINVCNENNSKSIIIFIVHQDGESALSETNIVR